MSRKEERRGPARDAPPAAYGGGAPRQADWMKNLLKNFLPYKKQIVLMVLILILQAYCDLALPGYTQDIIDVGIQNRGVEHILPQRITAGDARSVEALMTDQERKLWDESYDTAGDFYIRNDLDENRLDELDEALLIPVVLAFQAEQAAAGAESSQEAAGAKSSQEAVAQSDQDAPGTKVPGAQADQDAQGTEVPGAQDARKILQKTIDTSGTQTLHAMGAAFAAGAEERAGVDVNAGQTAYLWHQGLLMFLMALLMFAAAAVVSFIAVRVGAQIGRDLRGRLFRSVMSFSNAEMDRFSTASLITRCTNDVQQVQMTTTLLLRMVTYAPIIGIWGIIKVAQTGASMSWIIALAVLILIAFVALLFSITMPKFRIMQSLIDALNLVSREILTGLSVIRAFGREKEEEARFDKANIDLMKTQLFTGRVMSLMEPTMMMIMYGLTLFITWISAGRIDRGDLQVGAMTAFIAYSMIIVFSFLILTMMSILIPRAGVAADRIEEVITTSSSITEAADAKAIADPKGLVEFDHVSFRYPDAANDVLSDISFTAEPGKTTAIIGSTGSGKSTLINLIPRFYDITAGSLRVDGQEVRELKLNDLRKEIGLVPQKGVLFSGTIESNLRFGNENAEAEHLTEIVDIAQAAEFIKEKTEGLESAIAQGGSNVSGGQKQRLAIARALAADPKILIFDDSFSALDMKTDRQLRKALTEYTKDVTTIIVAQRISTIWHADQILVLDEGRLVGLWTHQELMESCSVYRQIARSQLSEAELEAV